MWFCRKDKHIKQLLICSLRKRIFCTQCFLHYSSMFIVLMPVVEMAMSIVIRIKKKTVCPTLWLLVQCNARLLHIEIFLLQSCESDMIWDIHCSLVLVHRSCDICSFYYLIIKTEYIYALNARVLVISHTHAAAIAHTHQLVYDALRLGTPNRVCLSCKPGNPASGAAGSTPGATRWFWTASNPASSFLYFLALTLSITHAETRLITSAPNIDLSRTRPPGKHCVNMFQIWADDGAAAHVCMEKYLSLHVCRATSHPKKSINTGQVDDENRNKRPLPSHSEPSSCILPFKHIVLTASPL